MEQNIFIEKIHALLSECPPEAAQPWYDFAVERVDQQQYVNFKAAESRDESVAEWLDALYEGLRQIKESFGPELAAKVAALGMDHCCLYPGEMPRAAECLQAGDGAKDILAKIESGEIDCENLFSAAAPTEKTYMSSQEFTARMDALIPAPSAEANRSLLASADGLWFELKEELYHTFAFISRHFTTEILQNVYDRCKTETQGMLPWELIGTAIYLQAGDSPPEIGTAEWKEFQILSTPESADTLSSLAACTVRENGAETRLYTLHFGQLDPQKLLERAEVQARIAGITVTEAMQRIDCDMRMTYATANQSICGPESPLTDKLFRLMDSSPVTAAHITIDVDSGSVAVQMNPLWKKLQDEREKNPPVPQKHPGKKRSSKHKNQPDR